MKPASAGSAWCGPRRHLSPKFTPLRPRSGGDQRRPSATGWPQRYRRRRNSKGAASRSVAPSALPRAPPSAVLLVRLTLSRLGPPRTASLSSAACASVGRRSPPCVAGPVARLALPRRTTRAVPRSAARSPCMSASAPGGCGSSASLRSRASGRAASPLLPSVPRPARARVLARALADCPAPLRSAGLQTQTGYAGQPTPSIVLNMY